MMETIENEFLKVSVAAHGAELSSIYDKEKQHEVIWCADPAYWNRHAPVLFPFVGKVNGGHYRYAGQEYSIGQHGFARDKEFTLAEKNDHSVTFALTYDEATLAIYPFAFELLVTHVLDGRSVKVQWQVRNLSEKEPMYFSIGGHPAFNCPADAGQKKSDYFVRFKGSDTLSYVLIDPAAEAVDAEHTHTLTTKDGYLPVSEELFAKDALIFDGGQVEEVSLCYPDQTPYVTLSCKGFPSFGLWSKPLADAPYICLEPWIGRCDNMGFAGELPDKFGEMSLDALGEFIAEYSICIQ